MQSIASTSLPRVTMKVTKTAVRGRALVVRAATEEKGALGKTPEWKRLNINKPKLIVQGGRTTRNMFGAMFEIKYDEKNDTVIVRNMDTKETFPTRIGEADLVEYDANNGTVGASLGLGSAPDFSSVMAFSGPAPEVVNARLAMVAFFGAAAMEVATDQTIVQQASSATGLGAAAALLMAVTAASFAPAFNGVPVNKVFPTANDSFPDSQLPTFWTQGAELINGRAAMVGLLAMLGYELVKGVPAL